MTSIGSSFGVPGSSDVNQMHLYDDVDANILSHHHTLGLAPGQSSPGDHIHNDRNGKKISVLDTLEAVSDVYTPTPVGGAINNFGNGIALGRYQRIGNIVFINVKITFGSTTTYNAGQAMLVPLPPPSDTNLDPNAIDSLLQARLLDTSAGQSYWGGALLDPAQDLTGTFRISFAGPAGSMTPTVPIAGGLAVNDVLHVSGWYMCSV